MSGLRYSLVMKDASLIDVEELKADLPSIELKVIQPQKDAESHNELATILIMALSAPAVTALTAWLLRTHDSEVIEYKVTVRNPGGSETDVHLKIKRSSSKAPKARIIKQIAEALKIPEDAIMAATS